MKKIILITMMFAAGFTYAQDYERELFDCIDQQYDYKLTIVSDAEMKNGIANYFYKLRVSDTNDDLIYTSKATQKQARGAMIFNIGGGASTPSGHATASSLNFIIRKDQAGYKYTLYEVSFAPLKLPRKLIFDCK